MNNGNCNVIGIDPGMHTGVAFCENGKLINVFETDFWGCIDYLLENPNATVVIEMPPTKHVWHNGAKTKCSIQRTGVNVGSCIREAELLIKWMHRNQRIYVIQKPMGKKNAAQFKQITGWNGRTNQHMRDAGMICFGLKLLSGNTEINDVDCNG